MNIIKHNLKFNGVLTPRTSTEYVIFHHSESFTGTVEDIHQWHRDRKWVGIGYNYVIYKDGSIHEGRPADMCDADAYGYNTNSISICFVGNFDVENMTSGQIASGILLLQDIRIKYPKIKAVRHKDVNDTACPGKYFQDAIIVKGMKPVEPKEDRVSVPVVVPFLTDEYKDCVDTVAKAVGLNSPLYWENNTDANVRRLIELTAKYIRENQKTNV